MHLSYISFRFFNFLEFDAVWNFFYSAIFSEVLFAVWASGRIFAWRHELCLLNVLNIQFFATYWFWQFFVCFLGIDGGTLFYFYWKFGVAGLIIGDSFEVDVFSFYYNGVLDYGWVWIVFGCNGNFLLFKFLLDDSFYLSLCFWYIFILFI